MYIELKDFDILSFTETWLNDSVHSDDLHFPSFHKPERKDRANNTYGGLIVYIKTNLTYCRRNDLEPIGLECIWIDLLLNHKHILIGTFYRPPGSGSSYYSMMEDSIHSAVNIGYQDIVIIGDLNLIC